LVRVVDLNVVGSCSCREQTR